MTPSITATEGQLARAFTEWDRRFREEPERFQSEATRLLKGTPETYGQACAPYLIAIINEQKENA
jgi:hypothetical protein